MRLLNILWLLLVVANVSVQAAEPVSVQDRVVHDDKRNRDIPVRIYLRAMRQPEPVVLFSHGLGGSREGSTYLAQHWAEHGYVVVMLQHAGSDAAVWQSVPAMQRMRALREAANGENLLLRIGDVKAVLDQLTRWQQTPGDMLAGRLDMQHIGMSGHSFGAVTTQMVSGEMLGKQDMSDSRIKAAVILSPSAPRAGDGDTAFANVHLPWLLMTGSKDVSPIGSIDVASRLSVYPALAAGDKYELVLADAQHASFGDRVANTGDAGRAHSFHQVILAFSTAFWDAYLRGDKTARSWLSSKAASALLERDDHLQNK
ncbi:alpha/beta hydrolase family protein [Sulfuriferula nivalis]|uniref:Dienelactone hydrolase n=1 Tax=Sulfuriferula nivalis TaxID=2675298 RepID=A0A809RDG4_9PROT|nr:dienelactone hydrolase [Sulfuriferula nivalis]BBO99808.1 hypothetical protein SFSGTM_05170 [Sulfuriferula nivalis]